MREKKSVPALTLQERIEALERQHRWWSWYTVAICILGGIGFWLVNRRLEEILSITNGIIGNIDRILGNIDLIIDFLGGLS